jgi:hypothetical protein
MKFLIALTVLASSTVFAQGMGNAKWVKCYDTAQGNDMEVVYKLKKYDRYINLVYPRDLAQQLEVKHDCLVSDYRSPEASVENRRIKFCPTDGQRVNGLVPVDVSMGHDHDDQEDEETVYCEKEIVKWIKWGDNRDDLY